MQISVWFECMCHSMTYYDKTNGVYWEWPYSQNWMIYACCMLFGKKILIYNLIHHFFFIFTYIRKIISRMFAIFNWRCLKGFKFYCSYPFFFKTNADRNCYSKILRKQLFALKFSYFFYFKAWVVILLDCHKFSASCI